MAIDESQEEQEQKKREKLEADLKAKKKKEEEEKKKHEHLHEEIIENIGNALDDENVVNLLKTISPGLIISELKDNIMEWDGKDVANHPLMKNPLVNHFAKTFANELMKLDKQSGNMLASGKLGLEGQYAMNQLRDFSATLPRASPDTGPKSKLTKMLGNLSPTKALAGVLARTAASWAMKGAKMAEKYEAKEKAKMTNAPRPQLQSGAPVDLSQPSQQQNVSAQQTPEKSGLMSAAKTASKMSGMLNKLSGGKVPSLPSEAATSSGSSKLAQSLLQGVKSMKPPTPGKK